MLFAKRSETISPRGATTEPEGQAYDNSGSLRKKQIGRRSRPPLAFRQQIVPLSKIGKIGSSAESGAFRPKYNLLGLYVNAVNTVILKIHPAASFHDEKSTGQKRKGGQFTEITQFF